MLEGKTQIWDEEEDDTEEEVQHYSILVTEERRRFKGEGHEKIKQLGAEQGHLKWHKRIKLYPFVPKEEK